MSIQRRHVGAFVDSTGTVTYKCDRVGISELLSPNSFLGRLPNNLGAPLEQALANRVRSLTVGFMLPDNDLLFGNRVVLDFNADHNRLGLARSTPHSGLGVTPRPPPPSDEMPWATCRVGMVDTGTTTLPRLEIQLVAGPIEPEYVGFEFPWRKQEATLRDCIRVLAGEDQDPSASSIPDPERFSKSLASFLWLTPTGLPHDGCKDFL